MTETFLDFEARTGGTYDPPDKVTQLARRFDSWEACPTLFRSPGPGGLRAWFEGTLDRLAHQDAPLVWLSDSETGTSPTESKLFGVLAILQPFHLQVCSTREEGSFLGVNAKLRSRTTHLGLGRDAIVWVPPSAIGRSVRWHHVSVERDAKQLFGPHLEAEKSKVLASLNAYLDELAAVEGAGAGPQDVAWYDVPVEERVAILEQHSLPARWSTVRA